MKVVKATVRLDIEQAKKQAREVGKELEKALRKAITSAKRSDSEFLALVKTLQLVKRSETQLRMEQERLSREMEKTKRSTLQTAAANERYQKSLQQTKAATARARTAEERLAKAKLQTATANKRLAEATARATATTKLLSREAVRNAGAHLKSAAATRIQYAAAGLLLGVFGGLVTAVKGAIEANIEYESSLTGVLKTSTGLHEVLSDGSVALTEFGKSVEEGIVGLSRDIPVAINGLLKIAELGAQLGVDSSSLETFTQVVAELEATTNITGESGALAIGKLRTVLGLTDETLLKFSDSLVFLGNTSSTTENDIARFAQRIAGSAAAVGLANSDLLAISSSFLSVGATASSAATAVQKVLFSIQTATESFDPTNLDSGNEQLKLFAELASAASQAAGEGAIDVARFVEIAQTDPGEAFLLFVEGLEASGRNLSTTLGELELSDARLIRSFASLTTATGTLNPEISLLREQMLGSAQAFEEGTARSEEFGLRAETTASKIELLKNAWNELQIAFLDGKAFDGAIEGLTGFVQGQTDAINTTEALIEARQRLQDVPVSEQQQTISGANIATNVPDIFGSANVEGTRQFQDALSSLRQELGTTMGSSADLQTELAIMTATLHLAESGASVTEEGIFDLALAFSESGQSAFEFYRELERTEVLTELQTQLGLTATQAEMLFSAISTEGFDLGSLPDEILNIVGGMDEFAEAIENLNVAEVTDAEDIAEIIGYGEAVGVATEETEGLSVALLESIGFSTQQAEAIAMAGDSAETSATQFEELEKSVDPLAEVALEVAEAFLDTSDAVENSVIEFAKLRVEAGDSASSIINLLESTNLLTEAELETVQATVNFASEQAILNEQVSTGAITQEEAVAQILAMAQALPQAAEETANYAKEVATLTSSLIDQTTVVGELTARFIDHAAANGATADQITLMAIASGELSDQQIQLVSTSAQLAAKEGELLALVREGALTYPQAAFALEQYAEAIGYTALQAEMAAPAVANFTSGLSNAGAAAGGAAGRAEDAEESFRDLFVGVVKGAKDFESIDNSSEAWADTLLDMSIAAGASVDQILALGLATGKFSDEQAKMLLNMAVAQRGVEAIADEYVAGEISAERASQAVADLSSQIESGAEIDLSKYGISAADMAAGANAVSQATGGAVRNIDTWRDSLLTASEAAGAKRSALIQLAAETGNYNDAQIQAALVEEARALALEELAEQIASGLSPEQAISDIEAFTSSLEGLSNIDLANLLDLAFDIPDLTGEQLEAIVQTFLDGEGTITVEAAVDLVINGESPEVEVTPVLSDEEITLEGKLNPVELEVTPVVGEVDTDFESQLTPTIDTSSLSDNIKQALSDIDANLDASVAPTVETAAIIAGIQAAVEEADSELALGINAGILSEAINTAVSESEYELQTVIDDEYISSILVSTITEPEFGLTLLVDGDEIASQIDEVTTEATYTTTIDADTSLVEQALARITNGDYEVKVKVTTDGLPSSDGTDDGTGSNPGGGGFRDGGKVPSFEDGGKIPSASSQPIQIFESGGKVSNVPNVATGSETLLKLATGGKLDGLSHADGGIPIEAEGGEYVISKDSVTPVTEPILDRINQIGQAAFGSTSAGLMKAIGLASNAEIPASITNALTGISANRIQLPPELSELGSTTRNIGSALSAMVENPTGLAPSQSVSDNRTNIDQSSKIENTTVNNYYGGEGRNADVTPAFSFGR